MQWPQRALHVRDVRLQIVKCTGDAGLELGGLDPRWAIRRNLVHCCHDCGDSRVLKKLSKSGQVQFKMRQTGCGNAGPSTSRLWVPRQKKGANYAFQNACDQLGSLHLLVDLRLITIAIRPCETIRYSCIVNKAVLGLRPRR